MLEEIKEIGENYISIFWQNFKYAGITAILNFMTVFAVMYSTTKKIKAGLKTFFEDEKKPMPKLPQKSIIFYEKCRKMHVKTKKSLVDDTRLDKISYLCHRNPC